MAQRRARGLILVAPLSSADCGGSARRKGQTPCETAGHARRCYILSDRLVHMGRCSLTIAGMQTSGQTGTRMIRDWKQWEGQTVNGTFLLRQYLGGSAHSAVFLTERRGREPQRAVIKLIPADPATAGVQLSRWEATAKLSHPHLLRLFESGSCQLDKVVLLYVVMEYAEDNLAQILPHRALTPAEVRDLLEPALDALTFIHAKGLVHSRLKPSNVLAAQDQLKLSSDSLLRTGETAGLSAPASAYDAPEVANGQILPASDAWSLGMTVMEALTQRLPACEGIAEPLPETVPAPFMGIAHCCLRLDPQRRCTVTDIAARLQSAPSNSPQPSTVRIPAGSAKWRYILLVAAVVLVAAALFIGPRLFRSSGAQPASSVSPNSPIPSEPAAVPEAQSAAPKAEPAPADAAKPSAIKTRSERPGLQSRCPGGTCRCGAAQPPETPIRAEFCSKFRRWCPNRRRTRSAAPSGSG